MKKTILSEKDTQLKKQAGFKIWEVRVSILASTPAEAEKKIANAISSIHGGILGNARLISQG